jgi:hypothetical protein
VAELAARLRSAWEGRISGCQLGKLSLDGLVERSVAVTEALQKQTA